MYIHTYIHTYVHTYIQTYGVKTRKPAHSKSLLRWAWICQYVQANHEGTKVDAGAKQRRSLVALLVGSHRLCSSHPHNWRREMCVFSLGKKYISRCRSMQLENYLKLWSLKITWSVPDFPKSSCRMSLIKFPLLLHFTRDQSRLHITSLPTNVFALHPCFFIVSWSLHLQPPDGSGNTINHKHN